MRSRFTSPFGDEEPSLFEPVGKRRLFESVLDQLEKLIHEGKLRVATGCPASGS
ncbi:hypothetical protein [Streptomyces sp. NPDC056672]|uniref:hypothetical protein n=1 Tax=Streptomyces sp. NPDC056672 TaxID=3345906 RepID=UPI0036B89F0E